MPRSPRLQLDTWLDQAKGKLRMSNKTRFMLLLLFFNGLLIVILLLSVRNQETRQRIQLVDREIRRQIEEIATRSASLVQLVYITATPLPTIAPSPTAAPPTPTRPSPTATPTNTPRPNTPTPTPSPAACNWALGYRWVRSSHTGVGASQIGFVSLSWPIPHPSRINNSKRRRPPHS